MTASETILNAFTHFRKPLLDDPELGLGKTLPPNGELLVKSIRLANRAIFNAALLDPELSGMGTTIVSIAIEADIMSVAHVGDSRAYRLGEKELTPLTKDHSWVAEIQESQNLSAEEASSVVGKNVITRALGVRETVEVDCRVVNAVPGDVFILCSDGLCGFADDDEIFNVASKSRNNLKQMTTDLVQMANDRGGADNVTVLAIAIVEVDETPLPEIEVFTQAAESERTLKAEDGWLKKLAEYDAAVESESADKPEKGGNTMLLIGIFAIFIIVAVLIIWCQTD